MKQVSDVKTQAQTPETKSDVISSLALPTLQAASDALRLPDSLGLDEILKKSMRYTLTPREEKAYQEVVAMLEPKKLGGNDTTLNQKDLDAVVQALLKDPQVREQINSGIWQRASSIAESHVPHGPLARLFGITALVGSIAHGKAEQEVNRNYGTYYAQGEQVATRRIATQFDGTLAKHGIEAPDKVPDVAPRQLTLKEIEQFATNLAILGNYAERTAQMVHATTVPMGSTGLSRENLMKLHEGDISGLGNGERIAFVPTKSTLSYATDAQLIRYGIPQKDINQFRSANDFYFDPQRQALIFHRKEGDEPGKSTWGERVIVQHGYRGYATFSGWQSIDVHTQIETERLDRYAQWTGESKLAVEKGERQYAQPRGAHFESLRGSEDGPFAGKEFYRRTSDGHQLVAIKDESKPTGWRILNPKEQRHFEKYEQHREWKKTFAAPIERADCSAIARLGLSPSLMHHYDFFLKGDAQSGQTVIYQAKNGSSAGSFSAAEAPRHNADSLRYIRPVSTEDLSRISALRGKEAPKVTALTPVDPENPDIQARISGYDKRSTTFYLGPMGELVARYQVAGKSYTAVNYHAASTGRTDDKKSVRWLMADSYSADVDKLQRKMES